MFAFFPKFGARTRPQDLWPFFISETGLKFLIWTQGKIHPGNRASPVNRAHMKRPSVGKTEPARPLVWTHRKFYKGFRGEARSRKPGQPVQPGSYEEALSSWKGLLLLQSTCNKKSYQRTSKTKSYQCFSLGWCRNVVSFVVVLWWDWEIRQILEHHILVGVMS